VEKVHNDEEEVGMRGQNTVQVKYEPKIHTIILTEIKNNKIKKPSCR